MFVTLPVRQAKPSPRWAAPLLLLALCACHLGALAQPQQTLLRHWGALSAGDAAQWLRDDRALRLFSALFVHADWAHLLGNAAFLLVFGPAAERALGSWRLLALFLLGGAVSNLMMLLDLGTPASDQSVHAVIGASGAVSAILGAHLALLPNARLGVALPLGLFLEYVEAPAFLLLGAWAGVQALFACFDPAAGAVAWLAHLAGFAFGIAFALAAKPAIEARLPR